MEGGQGQVLRVFSVRGHRPCDACRVSGSRFGVEERILEKLPINAQHDSCNWLLCRVLRVLQSEWEVRILLRGDAGVA